MARITPEVSKLVSAGTGLELPGDPTTQIIGRSEWVERNVASFRHMIEPATRKLVERGDGDEKRKESLE
jgi:hypothetical protein